MHPILLQLNFITIRSYGLMAAIGFLLGCLMINLNRQYAKMSSDQAFTSLFTAMIAGIIGARIFYVIQFFEKYQHQLWQIIRIDQGGLVFYGGFILAIAAQIVFCRMQKLDLLRVLDIYTPAMAIAHACGRVGCFLNGCCYGTPTALKIGVHYPSESEAYMRYPGQALHPVQLYETIEMLLFTGLFFYLVRHTKRGVAMSCYFAIYGVLRFINELFRGDNNRAFGLFTPAQMIGLVLIPLGISLAIYFSLRKDESKEITN